MKVHYLTCMKAHTGDQFHDFLTQQEIFEEGPCHIFIYVLSLLIGIVITLFKISKVEVLIEICSQNLFGFSVIFCLTKSSISFSPFSLAGKSLSTMSLVILLHLQC